MDAQAQINNWGPAAIIVIGYIAAAFWHSKRFDDFKLWIGAEIHRVNDTLTSELKRVETTLTSELKRLEEKMDNTSKRLEDKIDAARSPIAR